MLKEREKDSQTLIAFVIFFHYIPCSLYLPHLLVGVVYERPAIDGGIFLDKN